MKQSELNRHFTDLYEEIKTYAEKAKWHLASSYVDTSAILAECYLHLHKNIHLLKTVEDVESFSKNWVKKNLTWQSSPLKRQYQSKNQALDFDLESPQLVDFSCYDRAVESFLTTLNSHDRRLWSIYVEKGKTSGKLVAEHLNMSLSTGYEVLRQCKELHRKFRKHFLSNGYIVN